MFEDRQYKFINAISQMQSKLWGVNIDDVVFQISETPHGSDGSYSNDFFTLNGESIGLISINHRLLTTYLKFWLFETITHEVNHHLTQDSSLNDDNYAAHGKAFQDNYKSIGVTKIDEHGRINEYEPNGKFYQTFQKEFINLELPYEYQSIYESISEEKLTMQGVAICPKCGLRVVTKSKDELICKKCNVELDNHYKDKLYYEIQKRGITLLKVQEEFNHLCFIHPIKNLLNRGVIKKALEISTKKNFILDNSYEGDLDTYTKKLICKVALNLINSHKNFYKGQ